MNQYASGKIIWPVAVLLCLSLGAYVATDLFYQTFLLTLDRARPELPVRHVAPGAQRQRPVDNNVQAIISRNIFAAAPAPAQATAPPAPGLAQAAQPQATKLAVHLIGTIDGDAITARAIIADNTSKLAKLYRTGESIGGATATVTKIMRAKVLLDVNGRQEVLLLERTDSPNSPATTSQSDTPAPSAPPPPTIPVSRQLINNAWRNAAAILQRIKVTPHETRGQIEGFTVSQIAKGSFLDQMGVQDNDMLSSLNNEKVTTVQDALALYEKYKNAEAVEIQLLRDGKPQTLRYTIR